MALPYTRRSHKGHAAGQLQSAIRSKARVESISSHTTYVTTCWLRWCWLRSLVSCHILFLVHLRTLSMAQIRLIQERKEEILTRWGAIPTVAWRKAKKKSVRTVGPRGPVLNLIMTFGNAVSRPVNCRWHSPAQSFSVSGLIRDPWRNSCSFQDRLCVWKWGFLFDERTVI
jgi:hypothetical protein